MLVPLVRTLQECYPKATITWVISRPAYSLVEGMDGVEFVLIDKPKLLADYWQFYKQMRARRFDVLLATQASLRANLLYPFIRAKRKIGYDKRRAKDGHRLFIHESIAPGADHTLDGFLKFAEKLHLKKKTVRWDLPIEASDYEWAQQHLPKGDGPVVIVNPAASKPERSWLLENYIHVIRHLQLQWQAQVVLTGGPSDYDRQLGERISQAVPVTNLIGKTKPKQLLATISQSALVLCPDTGPSHMASAVGTPVIALHAVTSPDISGPYTFRHLAINRYPDALATRLKKSPGQDTFGTQAHGKNTMALISVEEVKARLDGFIAGLGYKSRVVSAAQS